jgi:hypothetical protein
VEVLIDRQPSCGGKRFDTVEVNHRFVTVSHA